MSFTRRPLAIAASLVLAAILSAWPGPVRPAQAITLLNVSYDPTRELYQEVNAAFAKQWKDKTGQELDFQESYLGSGAQARAIIGGFEADIAALSLAGDIQILFDNLYPSLPQVENGTLTGLCVTTPERSNLAPNLPTMRESAPELANFDISSWFGVFLPSSAPFPSETMPYARLLSPVQARISVPDKTWVRCSSGTVLRKISVFPMSV